MESYTLTLRTLTPRSRKVAPKSFLLLGVSNLVVCDVLTKAKTVRNKNKEGTNRENKPRQEDSFGRARVRRDVLFVKRTEQERHPKYKRCESYLQVEPTAHFNQAANLQRSCAKACCRLARNATLSCLCSKSRIWNLTHENIKYEKGRSLHTPRRRLWDRARHRVQRRVWEVYGVWRPPY